MNIFLVIIIGVMIFEYLIDLVTERLNLSSITTALPEEFSDTYDSQTYARSQNYLKDKTMYGLVKGGFYTAASVAFILCGGFAFIDNAARGFGQTEVITGLLFAGMLVIITTIIEIPFSAYDTFVLEERYGFNKTSPKVFIADIIKGLFLTFLLGGAALAVIIKLFDVWGQHAWIYCWIFMTAFQLLMVFIAPVLIMPMFNKFVPLEDNQLKEKIQRYADSQNFRLAGVYKMDASKRSSKSNAFFTGFGKFRRIALFDTLISRHTDDELLSILAHEIGHYKKKHILQSLVISVITSGLMFFLLGFFVKNRLLFDAFGVKHLSIYASLIFFGFLYTPISFFVSILGKFLSRRNEIEADKFAVATYGNPGAFISGLKKLSKDNLGNLTPHPVKVFLDYTHPPVMTRISLIRERMSGDGIEKP